jgi:hypothetical protein
MSPEDVFTLLCIVSLLATALVHSLLGERRLIGPLLLERHGPLADDLGRLLLRGVWHFMSVLFLVIAAALWSSLGANDRSATALLAATAIGIGGAGLVDAFASHGRHIGWPMLVLIGAFAATALILSA